MMERVAIMAREGMGATKFFKKAGGIPTSGFGGEGLPNLSSTEVTTSSSELNPSSGQEINTVRSFSEMTPRMCQASVPQSLEQGT